jgi:tetratricopeptide (TPR) repeat protein
LPPEDPFHLGQAKDLIGRGNHWYRRGCPAEAADWYLAGLEEARLADRVDLIVTALAALGAAHLRAGKLDLAAEALERALELSSSSPGSPELPTVWGNLGSLAFAAGRLADAKEFWLSALDEAGRRGLNPALYHCDLARLALAEGDEAGFRTRAATALELSETSSDAVRADALNLAARAAMADGDKALAEERLREALSLDRQGENQVGLAQDLETLASLEAASGRAGEAAASLDRAFYLWAALGDKTSQKRVLEALKSLKAESGRPKSLKPYEDVSRRPELFDPLSRLCP